MASNIRDDNRMATIIKYSSIKYIALIIGFLKGLINAKFLGPELLGLVGNLFLIITYINYSHLGIIYSMNREYTLYKNKDGLKAKKVIDTSFTFLVGISIIIFFIGSITSFIGFKNKTSNMVIYYALMFIIAIFEQFRQYFISYFRLIDDIRSINIIELINNIVSLIIILILIGNYKVYGVLIGTIVALLLVMIYIFISVKGIEIKMDKFVLLNLLKLGIPLLIYNLGYYIFTTVDRLFIIKYFSNTELGYYTFANQISTATLVFLQSILFLNYNNYISKLNIDNLRGNLEAISIVKEKENIIDMLGGVLIIIGSILIVPFVHLFLNKYVNSINIYRLLIVSVVFYKLSSYSNIYLVSNKRQNLLVILQVLVISIAIILNFTFIKLGMGLFGICVATAFSNFIYSLFQTIIFLKINKCDKIARHLVAIYGRNIVLSILVVLCGVKMGNIYCYSIIIILIYIILYFKDIKMLYVKIKKTN